MNVATIWRVKHLERCVIPGRHGVKGRGKAILSCQKMLKTAMPLLPQTSRQVRVYNMAPSISEVPTAEIVVPVKEVHEDLETKPKVRRVIEEEGGKTTASVRLDCSFTLLWTKSPGLTILSIRSISLPGTMARNTLRFNLSRTSITAKMLTHPSKTS